MPLPRDHHASSRAQRGAVGMFGIFVLVITLVFAVLALDTGRLALEKRRLQEIADLAAIDALQQAGLCSGADSMSAASVRAAAQQSAIRNGYDGDLSTEAGAVQLGVVNTTTDDEDPRHIRYFTATADAAASAVQVTARNQVVRSLIAGGWYGGTIDLQAVGVAQREPLAGFWVGSFLASIDSDDSPVLDAVLGDMLGSAISLDAVSYEGLIDADLTLAQLIDGAALAGVGLSANSVEGLLASDVTVADFFSIMAAALGADTDGDATAAAAINEMQAAATVAGTINIGELLNVSIDNPEEALASEVNAFALGSAALQLAREDETLNLSVPVSIPLVGATVDVSMHITEAPQIAIGPPGRDENGNWKTAASTAQMQVQVDVSVENAQLFSILLGAVNATIDIPIAAEVARTDAWLASIRCASTSQPTHRVTIGALPGAANVALGQYADLSDPTSLVEGASADIMLLGSSIATATISAEIIGRSAEPQDVEYDVVYDSDGESNLPQPRTVGSPLGSTLGDAMQSLVDSIPPPDVEVVGAPLPLGATDGLIQSSLLSVVLDPVLTELDGVLEPLFSALGVHLGGADIELVSLEERETRLVR